MIVPSIDLQGGQTVQLVGGETKAIDAGDPLPIARAVPHRGRNRGDRPRRRHGQGLQRSADRAVLAEAPARVGGGIRDLATAVRLARRRCRQVIIGTAAEPELLCSCPASG